MMNAIITTLALIFPAIATACAYVVCIYYPQQAQHNLRQTLLKTLTIGDVVVTQGGIIGTITHQLEKTYILRTYDGSYLEIIKTAIARRL